MPAQVKNYEEEVAKLSEEQALQKLVQSVCTSLDCSKILLNRTLYSLYL